MKKVKKLLTVMFLLSVLLGGPIPEDVLTKGKGLFGEEPIKPHH